MKNYELITKLIWHSFVCFWFYFDLILDIYTFYLYLTQSKYIYSILTLLFTILAIVFNTFIHLKELYGEYKSDGIWEKKRIILRILIIIFQLYFLRK